MGPHARLDIVEYPGSQGGPAAYDVSVVTAFRKDRTFVAQAPVSQATLGAVPTRVSLTSSTSRAYLVPDWFL